MGMPAVLTQNGTGTSAVWVPDWLQTPFVVGLALKPAGATGNLELTYDSLSSPTATAGNVTWFTAVAFVAGTNATATFTSPVQGFRINIATSLSTGVVTAVFVQATFPR